MLPIIMHEDIPVLRLQGRLDTYVIPSIESILDQIFNEAETPRVIINLMGVQYLDGSALDTLVGWQAKFQQEAGDIKLSSMRQTMRMRLKIENLTQFNIYDTDEQAYAAFLNEASSS